VEFAIILPVTFFIVSFAIDFGRAFLGWVNITNATRLGANYAALHPDANWASPSDKDRINYVALINNDLASTNCPLVAATMPSFSGTDLGDDVTVRLSCRFQPITPFITSVLGSTLTMTSHATFQVRSGEFGSTAPVPSPPPPSPDPDASPSPTPEPQCPVPNFINERKNNAQTLWNQAGFATTVTILPGSGNYAIGSQDKVAGQLYTCAGTTLTVGP
jgi:hypothetical protein